MVELRALGAIDLRRDGTEISAVLTRPKQVALILYLDVAQPRGFHRRDKIASLIWPELESPSSQEELEKAVRDVQRELGGNAITTRGDQLMLDPVFMRSDVRVLDAALDNTDDMRAVQLYQGWLADGFTLENCPAFEQWLDDERDRLRTSVSTAAWSLAEKAKANGRIDEATMFARSAASLRRGDEQSVRRLMEFLESVGDHAGALRSYDEFVIYLSGEFDATPDPDTSALRDSIRDSTPATPVTPEPIAPSTSSPPESASPDIAKPASSSGLAYVAYGSAAIAIAILILTATRCFS